MLADVVLILALSSSAALAQTAPAAEPPGVSGMLTLQMLLGLGLVIGLLFVGAYLLQRLNGGRAFGHSGPMKVIGGLMLSPKERILLIEVNDTWLIVGVVPGQIKTLHTLAKGELPDLEGNDSPFGQWLKQIAKRHHEPKQ